LVTYIYKCDWQSCCAWGGLKISQVGFYIIENFGQVVRSWSNWCTWRQTHSNYFETCKMFWSW